MDAPNEPQHFTVHFEKGVPTKVETDGQAVTGSVEVFKQLNKIGHDHGVGRIDIVENRFSTIISPPTVFLLFFTNA